MIDNDLVVLNKDMLNRFRQYTPFKEFIKEFKHDIIMDLSKSKKTIIPANKLIKVNVGELVFEREFNDLNLQIMYDKEVDFVFFSILVERAVISNGPKEFLDYKLQDADQINIVNNLFFDKLDYLSENCVCCFTRKQPAYMRIEKLLDDDRFIDKYNKIIINGDFPKDEVYIHGSDKFNDHKSEIFRMKTLRYSLLDENGQWNLYNICPMVFRIQTNYVENSMDITNKSDDDESLDMYKKIADGSFVDEVLDVMKDKNTRLANMFNEFFDKTGGVDEFKSFIQKRYDDGNLIRPYKAPYTGLVLEIQLDFPDDRFEDKDCFVEEMIMSLKYNPENIQFYGHISEETYKYLFVPQLEALHDEIMYYRDNNKLVYAVDHNIRELTSYEKVEDDIYMIKF